MRRGALALAAAMALAVLLSMGLHAVLEDDIRAHRHAYETQQLRSLQQEVAAAARLPAAVSLGQRLPASRLLAAYPLYEDGRLAAVLVHAEALNGYNGAVELLLGVRRGEETLPPRLRVLRHRETPGLADFLNNAPADAYDGVSGASISAAALVQTAAEVREWVIRCWGEGEASGCE